MNSKITPSIVRPTNFYARELYDLISDNESFLSEFLSWPKLVKSVRDVEKFIDDSKAGFMKNKSDTFVIQYNKQIVGVVSFNCFDMENNIGIIGYWIGENYQGMGIATQSVEKLIKLGFLEHNLNKVVIRTDVNNKHSSSLAERLNFHKEGVARENELINGKYVDHFIYSKLRSEVCY